MTQGKKRRFIRQESWRLKRIGPSWRRPRGKTSRMRRKIRGWPRIVKIGFRTSRQERGKHPSGLREVHVGNIKDLEGIDGTKSAVRISRRLGEKKALQLADRAAELGVRVLNPPGKRKEEPEAEIPTPESSSLEQPSSNPEERS